MSATDLEKWGAAQGPAPWEDSAGRQTGGPFAEYDALGRKVPRRLELPDYLLMVCRWDPTRVRRVPTVAIAEEVEDESLVACPCGAHPIVRSELAKCSGCERYYTRIEQGVVYVVYGAMAPPTATGASPTPTPVHHPSGEG